MTPATAPRTARHRILAIALGSVLGLAILLAYRSLRRSNLVGFVRSTSDAARLADLRQKAEQSQRDAPKHHLPRFPITEEIARQIFPIDGEVQEYDEQVYFRRLPNADITIAWHEHPNGKWQMHTNSLSLREDAEPMTEKPDVRILVTGDSHSEGVCDNRDTFTHVLERALRTAHPKKTIEAINAAKGGYSFYNYLGALEKFLYLKPDVFIVAVYGGNDFEEVLAPYHFFEATPRPPGSTRYWANVEKALAIRASWLAQDGLSLKYFQEHPAEIEVASRAAQQASLDIQDICREHGIALLYAYIPSRFEGEDSSFRTEPGHPDLAQELYDVMEIRPASIETHEAMANAFVSFLREHSIPVVDVRAVFRSNAGPFYWRRDHHVNVNGHRAIGEALVPLVENAGLAALR